MKKNLWFLVFSVMVLTGCANFLNARVGGIPEEDDPYRAIAVATSYEGVISAIRDSAATVASRGGVKEYPVFVKTALLQNPVLRSAHARIIQHFTNLRDVYPVGCDLATFESRTTDLKGWASAAQRLEIVKAIEEREAVATKVVVTRQKLQLCDD